MISRTVKLLKSASSTPLHPNRFPNRVAPRQHSFCRMHTQHLLGCGTWKLTKEENDEVREKGGQVIRGKRETHQKTSPNSQV